MTPNTPLTDMTTAQDRLANCWHHWDCDTCVQSSSECGWCPVSSTCIPASNLLEPVSRKNVCPLPEERFELRTRTFGCGCNTTTLLSIIVTFFATAIGFMVFYAVVVSLLRLNRTLGTGTWQGLEVEIKADGTRVERRWRRGNWLTKWFSTLGRHKPDPNKSEQEQITERSRLLG